MISRVKNAALREKYRAVIEAYKRYGNMRETADVCKLTIGRVQQILQKHAPEIIHRQGVRSEYRKQW